MSTANDFHHFLKFVNFLTSGANDPYPDAVVSLWRLDSEGKVAETFLYVAALIKSNCIIVLQKFLYNLESTPYIISNNIYSCGEVVVEDSGYFIGWHKKVKIHYW